MRDTAGLLESGGRALRRWRRHVTRGRIDDGLWLARRRFRGRDLGLASGYVGVGSGMHIVFRQG
ncbi:hypothetical protein C2U69_07310 [Cupriavidus pinatubonensis]|nr:hypothetical protein C2U69_07310 [Cupriavidus pinatubonensis]